MYTIKKLTDCFDKEDIRTIAVVDLQWGDAGKGKLTDCLAEWADVIARGTGGANAGHTITCNGKTHIFHLLPSGIMWDEAGKHNIIGRGVAVEPRTLAGELYELEEAKKTYNGLLLSCHAYLVLPFDIALDRLKEASNGKRAIGTTGRGIGPAYESHVSRIGLTVNDLLNKDVFAKRLKRNWEARIGIFKQFNSELVREVLHLDELESGALYAGPRKIFDVDAIVEYYVMHAEKFRHAITDTDTFMWSVIGKKRVLLEGAQGVLLSVTYGSYPYVTSSDCSLAGLITGVGLTTEHVDYTLGVVKAPYMTRVGKGPFPTELGGVASDEWCNGVNGTKTVESQRYPAVSINSSDAIQQGIAMRIAGNEYGATTGRLRRVGWLDLPLLRYAAMYGASTIALTKVDVLNTCEVIKLCIGYRYMGEVYHVGEKTLLPGMHLKTAIMDSYVLDQCVPIYMDFPGWCSDISNVRFPKDIPEELRTIIDVIEQYAEVRVDMISVGVDRDAIIVM